MYLQFIKIKLCFWQHVTDLSLHCVSPSSSTSYISQIGQCVAIQELYHSPDAIHQILSTLFLSICTFIKFLYFGFWLWKDLCVKRDNEMCVLHTVQYNINITYESSVIVLSFRYEVC